MKLFVLNVIVLICISIMPAMAQHSFGDNISDPIDAGIFGVCGSRTFIDYQNNCPSNGFGDDYGQPSDDVWYSFSVYNSNPVNISLCGSNFDTFLHLLDENGNEIASNDDSGPLCGNLTSSIQMSLSPGTYYVVVEGYNDICGDIVLEISNTGSTGEGESTPPGDTLSTAIDAGTLSTPFTGYGNNSPMSCYQDRMGQPSPEIYYKFSLSDLSKVDISLCGSDFDTYLHLLDVNGTEIASNDDEGPLCTGLQSSIQVTLTPGTYYVVAEGYNDFYGNIVLQMSKTICIPPPGANLATAIDAGALSMDFMDTRNNSPISGYQNLIGEQSNEIYYKFTLNSSSEVCISHCGTTIDTYLHLLNASGSEIAFNDNNGPLCSGFQASIRMTLAAGLYYVVSEGKGSYFGNITTTIIKPPTPDIPPAGTNFSQNQNYIVTYAPTVSGILDVSDYPLKGINDFNVQVKYFDGLGRPMQNVTINGSPLLKDVVQPIAYDKIGRESKKYLPFVSANSDGRYVENDTTFQAEFYINGAAKCATDDRPFSETIFEPSPLNRPTQQYGPGQSWHPSHPVTIDYLSNEAGEVKLWTISGSTVSNTGCYNAGSLFKTQTTDENGNISWEYKDLQGKVVLKKVASDQGDLKTYYVYNDFEHLAYVIPPIATADSYTENTNDFNEMLYGYKYDGKGRMTEKHIPGGGWVYMVYNNLDKLILTQDAKQREGDTWIFSKYDVFGRLVMTGTVVLPYLTRNDIQEMVKSETILWETRDNFLFSGFCYTSDAFPQSNNSENYVCSPLTVNYYDTYGFSNDIPDYVQSLDNPANNTVTTGLLTGTKVKVLDDSETWLTTVTYYDSKGRPLQVFKKNILNVWDRYTSQYDFTGKVMQSEQLRDLTIINRYVYDHSGRKKEVYQKTNNDPEVELAEYHYNELGQLVKKNLHGDSISHLQGINYRYNIRGWLTSINNSKLDNDGSLNDEDNVAFGEELSYNNGFEAGSVTGAAQWNGNISGMKWKTKGPDVSYSSIPVNAYAFQYDKLNRMTLANYGLGFNGGSWNDWGGYFNEQVSYDAMGNIKTLQRRSGPDDLDKLVYNYLSNSNKLLSVTDNSGNNLGFNDGNQSGNDYEYDSNGNLTKDLNKKLVFSYNYLNLPQKVSSTLYSGMEVDYLYDATGQKLKKSFPGEVGHYYIDGFEYDGGSLIFAMTEEGRVRPKGDGTYTYDYFLKDHLGNVRVVLGTDNSGQSMVYPAASMETATAATENTYYSNLEKVRNVTPVGFKSLKKNEKVAHLKGTDPNKQIGPSITVKVNSGDKISLTAQSFYPDNTGAQRTGLAETALSQLVNAMINPTGLGDKGKAIATERLKAQGFEKSTDYQDMMNRLPNSDYGNENNRPKAYMVWMLFDKEMKLVKTGKSSGARQIPEGAGQVKQMAESDIVIDQGGFLTAYTVNESPSSVYIDNFQLSVVSGNVLDENSYYPFGMINDGLSNTGYTDPINNYKYNGKEQQNELSLGWLDYGARFYDPQIGRFSTSDPLADKYYSLSAFCYVADNPLKFIDPDGRVIVFAKGSTTEFKKQFSSAVKYLNDHNAGSIITSLQNSPRIITLTQADGDSKFIGNNTTIKWNPFTGLKTNSNKYLSPTSVLNHEADHANEYITDKDKFRNDNDEKTGGDIQFDTKEEKRVIQGSEKETAAKLGEVFWGEETRNDHDGTLYQTTGVTSNEIKIPTPIKHEKKTKNNTNKRHGTDQ